MRGRTVAPAIVQVMGGESAKKCVSYASMFVGIECNWRLCGGDVGCRLAARLELARQEITARTDIFIHSFTAYVT